MDFDRFWHRNLGRPYRLYATSHGDKDKPVIVLLHGIAASSEDWGKLIPLLTSQYRCITIDLLGFAESPKPQWAAYTMDDHLRAIRRTINELDLTRPFILAGHSLGGLLAADYARRYPQEISRLLLLSPPIYPPPDSITGKAALRRTDMLMRTYRFMRTHPRSTPENFRRLSHIGLVPKSITASPDAWLPFMRSLEHCIEQQTIIEDIKSLDVPIDVFYGSLDTVVVGANVRQIASRPNLSLHAFRGNHSIGATYARTVATTLGVGPIRRRLPRAILKRSEGPIKIRTARHRHPLPPRQ